MSEKPSNFYMFKRPVPEELIERFFKAVEVEHKNDFHWWPESMLSVPSIKEKVDNLIDELVPYYINCYSFYAKRVSCMRHYIQIYRHLAIQWGRRLEHAECRKISIRKRGKSYRIFSETTEPIQGEYAVEFR